MVNLDSLKHALRQKATAGPRQPLSATQYRAGFSILTQESGWATYEEFIIPQLSRLLAPLFQSRTHISVLEIGPGPKTVLEHLPDCRRRKIKKYTAFEPNDLFAADLEAQLDPTSSASALPCLRSPPRIHRMPFSVRDTTGDKFDVVLFCHSMYGMESKERVIRKSLEMLGGSHHELVVVFHREALSLPGLVCHRTASFPTGVVGVADDDQALDSFAAFIAGFTTPDETVRAEWRNVCRKLGFREHNRLQFSAPDVMVAFTQHATALPELAARVPLLPENIAVKNREARLHHPPAIARPTQICHIQECVRWALRHNVGLTVIGGGHSGHCLQPHVVAVDMGAFNQVHISSSGASDPLVFAGAGCKTEDIVRKAMAAGLAVPLGARPSVGAGLWLQGGIGHLTRLHGLTCDAIVGAVMVSVASGEVVTVGRVPSQHQPPDTVHRDDPDLLWAIKGAGTNVGIVVGVVFRAFEAPTYRVRNWVVPVNDEPDMRQRLVEFDRDIARPLPTNSSADAFMYWSDGRMHLGVTTYETVTRTPATPTPSPVETLLGPPAASTTVDGVGIFDTEMYVSGMHGGHGGGKTSSFKRCVFLESIGHSDTISVLMAALERRPTPWCYLHLLHGGGAVGDVAAGSTAFGRRDWDFACVITGVWPRERDGTPLAQAAVRWVYEVAEGLSGSITGAYAADLGPDPRDAALAVKAFGPNLPRLVRIKQRVDPRNVLAYAFPIPRAPMKPRLIVLVTGPSAAGKDNLAEVFASVFLQRRFSARAVSISEATKREYAAATGADLSRLLEDRPYKEQHRSSLTAFFREQVRQRPQLPKEHFLRVVHGAADVDVLFITGMRDRAPVASFSHLVPDSRLVEVRIETSLETRQARLRSDNDRPGEEVGNDDNRPGPLSNTTGDEVGIPPSSEEDGPRRNPEAKLCNDNRPCLFFDNNTAGADAAQEFAERRLLPFLHKDLERLASMVRVVPDFPRPGIEFRHVLDISQHPDGLALCTSLFRSHFSGDWARVDAIACCEAGGLVFASAVASRVNVRLAIIRKFGKLPPPTISAAKELSHISSSASGDAVERIEMDRDIVPLGALVLVVDDVLATGETLCAVLRLLREAGVGAGNVSVMVVAEFPVHRGRELLRRHGFGSVRIQSLLVFGGA